LTKKVLDFYKEGLSLNKEEISLLVFGNVIAFIVAILAIKFFIGMLNKHGFRGFGWYRIIVGAVLIILFLLKVPLSVV
jgi:undecaprenyl-diphosphatase